MSDQDPSKRDHERNGAMKADEGAAGTADPIDPSDVPDPEALHERIGVAATGPGLVAGALEEPGAAPPWLVAVTADTPAPSPSTESAATDAVRGAEGAGRDRTDGSAPGSLEAAGGGPVGSGGEAKHSVLPASRADTVPVDLEDGVDWYRSAMHPKLGLLVRLFLVPFFARVRFSEQAESQVRRAAEQGVPVYVMRTVSLLDFLYLNFVCIVRGLPLARFANEIFSTPWGTLRSALRTLKAKVRRRREKGPLPDPVASGYLADLVAAGHPAVLFMRRRDAWRHHLGHRPPQVAVTTALVAAQRRLHRPIFLIPQVLVWSRRPDAQQRTFLDVLFGNRDDPGPLRHLGRFLLHHRRVSLVTGEPLNLQAFLERAGKDRGGRPRTDAQLGRMLRLLMLLQVNRELRVVQGPNVRPRRVLIERTVGDPDVQRAIADEARRRNVERRTMERRVRKYLRRISADVSMSVVDVADFFLQRVWSRMYDEIVVDPGEIERLRRLARRGTVVLIPCHRSHLDYLLVSDVLYAHDLAIPHIAAGINLSFWPLGPVFRRMGAFFVQRTFKDDRISPVLIKKYVAGLLREGHTLEFFIEGGRSRTGLLLQPKLGLLSMIADQVAGSSSAQETVVVPVAIGYERVVETAHYLAEAQGGRKTPESLAGVLRSVRVLGHRFGKVHLGFLDPIPLRATLAAVPGGYREDMGWAEKKAVLKPLGSRILTQIARRTPVTITQIVAAALLGHTRRGILERVLLARVRTLVRIFEVAGQPTAFNKADEEIAAHLQDAVSHFLRQGCLSEYRDTERRIFAIVEERRLELDYYKNGALTPLAPDALLACAVRSLIPGPFAWDDLRDRFTFLVDLFQETFVFDPDVDTDGMLAQALEHLETLRILGPDGDGEGESGMPPTASGPLERRDHAAGYVPMTEGQAELEALVALQQPHLEAVSVALRTAGLLRHEQLAEQVFQKRLIEQANAMYMTEEILRKEATNVFLLRTALARLRRMGLFATVGSGAGGGDSARLALDQEAWDHLRDRLQPFLEERH